MSLGRRIRGASGLVGLACALVPFACGLGAWALFEPDEGRNAEIAREMVGGDWIVPHLNGLPFLDKPPALFWAVAAAFRTFGRSEWVARLPSMLAALATIACAYALARALLDRRRAVVTAVVLATSPMMLVLGRLVIFDMPLTAFVTIASYAMLRARLDDAAWRWLPAAGVALGAALLTKGPVGVVLPLIVWVAVRGVLPGCPSRHGGRAFAFALVVAVAMLAAWVAAVLPHEPDFLRYAVVEETLLRVASSEHFHRGGPPYYYLKTIPWALGIWILPLVVLAPTLVRIARQGGRDGTAVRLAARAAAVIVVFFTLSASKRPQYVLPALAPLSLLVAIGMAARPALTARMFAVAGGLCVVVGCGALVASRPGLMPTPPDIALPVTEIVRVAGLVLLPLGAAMACGGRRAGWAIPAAAALAPCLVLALLPPLAIYAERRSARQIAASIPADSPVVCFDAFRPSLPFYLNRTVTVLSDGGSALTSNYVVSQRARLREPTLGFKRSLPDVLTANPGAHVVIGAGQLGRLKRFAPDHRFEEVAGDTRSTLLRAVAENRAERTVLDGATGSVANGRTR